MKQAPLSLDYIFIELTNACNSKCIHCSYWHNKEKCTHISYERLKWFIEAIKDFKPHTVMLTGGEPLMHPNIIDIIIHLHNLGYKIKVTTNGVFLNQLPITLIDYLDEIVISFDSSNADLYQRIRGINAFDSIVQSISRIKVRSLKTKIKGSFLIQKGNYLDLINFLKFAKKIGMNSVAILLPNAFGDFSQNMEQNEYTKRVSMNTLEIEEFEVKIFPALKSFIHEHPGFVNRSIKEIDLIPTYLKELNMTDPKIKFRALKCSLPLKSISIFSDHSLKACPFLPLQDNIPYTKQQLAIRMRTFRSDYIFNKIYFTDYCTRCLEVPL